MTEVLIASKQSTLLATYLMDDIYFQVIEKEGDGVLEKGKWRERISTARSL